MTDLVKIVLLSILGGVVGLAGGVAMLTVKPWTKILSKYAVPFAAGVLLTVSLLGLIPEAVEITGEAAMGIVFLGFLAAYIFESVFFALHHHVGHEHDKHSASVGLIIFGDTIHNFIDGIAIAASYLISPGLGLITAISTLLHEIPHEIGDFGILLKAGWKKGKIIGVNLISGLATVLGALAVYYLKPSELIEGNLLAVAAGLFLYLGASDFLPQAGEDDNKWRSMLVMLLGVGVMYLTLSLVPHSH